MADNKTWTKANMPPGKSAIPCKMVFKRKLDDHGQVSRYKARLVAKGFFQKAGIDYHETFASVASFKSLHLLVGKFVSEKWRVHHAYISTVFLNRDINVDLFVSWEDVVYKLKKSLYGLKQSPGLWYEKLKILLQGLGFKQLSSCECCFETTAKTYRVIILVYVDDLIILSSTLSDVTWVKEKLDTLFKMKDLSELKYYLGISI